MLNLKSKGLMRLTTGIALMIMGNAIACETEGLSVVEYQKSMTMALHLYNALEMHQPRVALVARVGSDLSEYGLTYSHMGFVRRNHPAGKWIFTHLLNHCNQSTSALFDQGLVPFFSDRPFRYQAQLIIPTPALQNELEQLLSSGATQKLHQRRYSVIANAAETKYQNSNQWVLEVLAVAKSIYLPSDRRTAALRLAKAFGYQPEHIKIGGLKKLGALLFHPNVHFDDHRGTGRYQVVSVRSVVSFLKRNQDVIHIEEWALNGSKKVLFQLPADKYTVKPNSPQRAIITRSHRGSNNLNQNEFWRH